MTYLTGANNELLCDGTYNYQYDADGNCIARWQSQNGFDGTPQSGDTSITVYTWDNRNRLTSVTAYGSYLDYENGTNASQTVTYVYDAFNRWVGETIMANGQTTQTRYVYDGNQIVLQFDNISSPASGEGQGEGLPLGASNLSHRYLWGPAVDQLLADEQVTNGDLLVWTLGDNENTIRDLATYNAGQTTIVNHRVFSAYGQLLTQTNPSGGAIGASCLFAYTGEALDTATGLQNNDNRWYNSITGRWLSQDPSGLVPDSNPYRYCGNAAPTRVDSTGLMDRFPTPFLNVVYDTQIEFPAGARGMIGITGEKPPAQRMAAFRSRMLQLVRFVWTPYMRRTPK